MSEVELQKETEYVAGVIEGITQKGPDKWQVGVKPDGSQYAKNLWTKDSELVAALSQKIGQNGAFACNVSHWTNNDGKPVRSLWIEGLSDGQTQTHNSATVMSAAPISEGMTPEKWDAKERRDYRSRAWAQTLAAFAPAIAEEAANGTSMEDIFARLQPFQRKVFTDVCQSFAFPVTDEDENVPF